MWDCFFFSFLVVRPLLNEGSMLISKIDPWLQLSMFFLCCHFFFTQQKREKKTTEIFLPTFSKNHLCIVCLIDHYKCLCLLHTFYSFLIRSLTGYMYYSSHKRQTRIAIYPHLSLFLLITWMWCAECNVCYVSEKVIYCSFSGKNLREKHACTHMNCMLCKDEKPTKEINGKTQKSNDSEKKRTKLEKKKKKK